MALIKCPYCGSNISDKAHKCPKCGHMLRTSDNPKIGQKPKDSTNTGIHSYETPAKASLSPIEKERSRTYWPWFVVGGAILVGFGVWLILSKNTADSHLKTGYEVDSVLEEVEERSVEEVIDTSEFDNGVEDAEQTGEAAEVKEDNAESVLYIGEPSTKQGTYKLTGKIDDKYDIKIWLTINENKIFGKYCYVSTLEKYGDHPSSYIQFDGLISPADFFIITASSKDSAKWEGDFKENRLYAEKILETGEIRTMEAYIDE